MGWNSWNIWRSLLTDEKVRQSWQMNNTDTLAIRERAHALGHEKNRHLPMLTISAR